MTKGATAVERYSAGESAPKIAEQLGVTSRPFTWPRERVELHEDLFRTTPRKK